MDWTAIATLILAGVTVLLVFATFLLASRAAEETRAQYRPIILLRESAPTRGRGQPLVPMMLHDNRLRLVVGNNGRGPALEVFAFLLYPAGTAAESQQHSSLAPDEFAELEFTLSSPPKDFISGNLRYTDISQALHSTSFTISLIGETLKIHQTVATQPLRFEWRRVGPRRFRRHLRTLTKRVLRRPRYESP